MSPNQHTGSHSVFGYPGNKAQHAAWILDHLPDHRVYVEPFGGAAGVLANKPDSHIEVYNDLDGDLVNFFDVLRERGDELHAWLQDLPYSREKYEAWADRWHSEGWRPEDDVKRAGVLFFLQSASFGSKYRYNGGFAVSRVRNQPNTFRNQVDRLQAFADRFRGQVLIEHQDWRDCLSKWDEDVDDEDAEPVVFYLDPPYYDTTNRYKKGHDFDHDEFGTVLDSLNADWAVSYGELPPAVDAAAETVVCRTTKYEMAAGTNGSSTERVERLALSFDPEERDSFVDSQSHLDQFSNPGQGPNRDRGGIGVEQGGGSR